MPDFPANPAEQDSFQPGGPDTDTWMWRATKDCWQYVGVKPFVPVPIPNLLPGFTIQTGVQASTAAGKVQTNTFPVPFDDIPFMVTSFAGPTTPNKWVAETTVSNITPTEWRVARENLQPTLDPAAGPVNWLAIGSMNGPNPTTNQFIIGDIMIQWGMASDRANPGPLTVPFHSPFGAAPTITVAAYNDGNWPDFFNQAHALGAISVNDFVVNRQGLRTGNTALDVFWLAMGPVVGKTTAPQELLTNGNLLQWGTIASAPGKGTITFPTPFKDAPAVFMTGGQHVPGGTQCTATNGVDKTQVVYSRTDNNDNKLDGQPLHWLAVGPPLPAYNVETLADHFDLTQITEAWFAKDAVDVAGRIPTWTGRINGINLAGVSAVRSPKSGVVDGVPVVNMQTPNVAMSLPNNQYFSILEIGFWDNNLKDGAAYADIYTTARFNNASGDYYLHYFASGTSTDLAPAPATPVKFQYKFNTHLLPPGATRQQGANLVTGNRGETYAGYTKGNGFGTLVSTSTTVALAMNRYRGAGTSPNATSGVALLALVALKAAPTDQQVQDITNFVLRDAGLI